MYSTENQKYLYGLGILDRHCNIIGQSDYYSTYAWSTLLIVLEEMTKELDNIEGYRITMEDRINFIRMGSFEKNYKREGQEFVFSVKRNQIKNVDDMRQEHQKALAIMEDRKKKRLGKGANKNDEYSF